MYFGCAVVSTWVGGLPNLIQHEHNGLLIPPSAHALGAAITRLIDDEDLRAQLGTNARANVLPGYGIDRWRQRITAVLEQHLALASPAQEGAA